MNYIVLASGTVILVFISWFLSIKDKRYHGIARFFSFESILILFLLNWRLWFRNPFAWNQIIAWILLFSSIYPVVAGYLLLKRKGKSEKSLENTTILIKSGIYRYIRHPLYCSLLLLAKIEEKEMLVKFGNQYSDYMKETKMFIPFIV
jgi:protein-S-isoprenylcysteine O-methyltransferase Ste14